MYKVTLKESYKEIKLKPINEREMEEAIKCFKFLSEHSLEELTMLVEPYNPDKVELMSFEEALEKVRNGEN